MENSILSKILLTFKNDLIQEIVFSDFCENIFLLSQREEFKGILYDDFVLNGDSFKFSYELNECINNGYLLNENNGMYYILINTDQMNKIYKNITNDERIKYLKLSSEYVKLNMKKNKIKVLK